MQTRTKKGFPNVSAANTSLHTVFCQNTQQNQLAQVQILVKEWCRFLWLSYTPRFEGAMKRKYNFAQLKELAVGNSTKPQKVFFFFPQKNTQHNIKLSNFVLQ